MRFNNQIPHFKLKEQILFYKMIYQHNSMYSMFRYELACVANFTPPFRLLFFLFIFFFLNKSNTDVGKADRANQNQ